LLRLPFYLHVKSNSDVSQAVMLIGMNIRIYVNLSSRQLFTLNALILIFVNYPTTMTDPVYVHSYLFEKWSFIQYMLYLSENLMANIYLQQLNFGVCC
jgi:hypothetical protein